MPTITAQNIIDKAVIILQDTSHIRWPESELLGWLNDGQREIVQIRPDTYSKTTTVSLAAGTKQTIPSDGYQLLTVVRNMGVGGATPGKAIRNVPQSLLDSNVPGWHSAAQDPVTLHFTFDPRTPRIFYVYPPSTGTTQVEIKYSAAPPNITIGATILLDDVYAGPLLDYVLYRAYSKDADLVGNVERAVAHRTAFENSLSLKASADAASVPQANVRG